jgi:16S rRNA (cytosine1402-N4)-methyltransferase
VSGIHQPVMAREVARHLVTKADGIYIDGTAGAGGHTEVILSGLSGKGKILGIDRDEQILDVARRRVDDSRAIWLHGSYEDLEDACRLLEVDRVDGILLDLGVSSLQFDVPERGFSFSKEAPLDMRMDATSNDATARDILQTSSAQNLERILREFGEEPFARRIAAAVVEMRRRNPLETTSQLADLVSRAVPRKAWPKRIHPATRTFQALRIAVNRELERLDAFLETVPTFLAPGGRAAVISYHSLEDRRVKQSFLKWDREGVLGRVTKKPLVPSDEEIRENPRSRSAKLRVAEKWESAS